jgi:hypothetical protein
LRLDTPDTFAVGTGYCEVVASSCVTICWALATPAAAELVTEGELLALELELVLELLLELQAASRAAAVIAAPGATQRFHLCVIAP